jgi:hypothetical protein
MDNQNNLVDYDAESKVLEDAKSKNYWNAKEGKFEVVALSELSKFQQADKDGTLKEKARIDIEVSGQKYAWTMGVGQTKASLYGQLINLAKEKGNKLTGQKFTVVIKNDGKKRDFTIV